MAVTPAPARPLTSSIPAPPLDVLIIGTGFSGLCAAIQLKKAGIDAFTMLERASDLGGTWRDNTYPGCACDVPSHLYSFSFERRGDWTRKFPEQKEIHAYQKHCADKYGLYDHIRFQSAVTKAIFDEAAGQWSVHTADGRRFRARTLISCVGGLTRPTVPEIRGLDQFAGQVFHSAEWNHDYDLTGKRVAAIGTGASAIQFVPEIAPLVDQLHVFQRTPPWIFPKPDRPFLRIEKFLLTHVPGLERAYRSALYWLRELGARLFIDGTFRGRGLAEYIAHKFIRDSLSDPALRAAVTPTYSLGCKRILLSNDWYPTLIRDNVELVTDGIRRITPTGVVTEDGVERRVDAIIFGTGFKATEFLVPLRLYGADGQELSEMWQSGAHAHLGITVNGFPNLFITFGPNTGLGHNSMVFMIEAQVRYTVHCIRKLLTENLRTLEIRADAQQAFQHEVQTKLQKTVWMTGCQSWYQSADGQIYTLWPGFTVDYWWRTRRPRAADFLAH